MFVKFAKAMIITIICLLILMISGFVVFADTNIGGGGGTTWGGGYCNSCVYMWKVSVYKGNEGVSKTSSIDNFTHMCTAYFGCGNTDNSVPHQESASAWRWYNGYKEIQAERMYYTRNFKVPSGNKISYAHGQSFSVTNITDFTFVCNRNVPYAVLGTNQKNYFDSVKSYFIDQAYARIRDDLGLGHLIGENDPWVLCVEPCVFDNNLNNFAKSWLLTPTEYVLAHENAWNGYNCIGRNSSTMVIYSSANFVYFTEGDWLGIGSHNPDYAWMNYSTNNSIRDNWWNLRNSVIKYGGAGMAFSGYFNHPDFSINGNTLQCNTNVMEGVKQDISVNVSCNKLLSHNVPVYLYIDDQIVSETTVNFYDSMEKTAIFTGVDFGAYGTKTMKIIINPNFDNPKEIITNNNMCSTNVYVQRPNFNVSLSTSNDNPYEKEIITVKATVKLDTYGGAGDFSAQTDVKLDYNGTDFELKDSQTKTVSLSNSSTSAEVTWELQVGTYSQTVDDAIKELKATITPYGFSLNTQEVNTNDNFTTKGITLKRDMIVTSITIDRNNVFENENVNVTFIIKNKNPYRGYDNLPMTVYFKDPLDNKTKLAQTTVSLSGGEEKTCRIRVNVGCVSANADQNDSIYVAFNHNYPSSAWSVWHEADANNNLKGVNVKVKRDINLSIKLVNPNASYSGNAAGVKSAEQAKKTQAVTSCIVYNDSRFDLYGANTMHDTITVVFYVNGNEAGRKTTVIPANGSNLVFFKWNVPESTQASLSVKLLWSVDQENSANPYADNSAAISKQIVTVRNYSTPDTTLQKNNNSANNYFTSNAYVKHKPYIAKWSQWVCDNNGSFTLINYALSTESETILTPMQSAQYSNGSTIAAGSAFSASFNYNIKTECSNENYSVSTSDYTYMQNVVALFPEFQYSAAGDCRTMYLAGDGNTLSARNFQFATNSAADGNQRVHFTPVNMPDGQYKVGMMGYDLWTPAGMLYVNGAGSLMINGSVYDDHYVS